MDKNIRIRRAEARDADRIFDFVCWLEESSFDETRFKKIFLENISGEKNIYLVAVNESDEAAGFISCHGQELLHHGGMVYEIQELYVDRRFRDKGVGVALLKTLQDELKNEDWNSLEVAVNKERKAAHGFYSGNGFSSTHFKFTKKPAIEKSSRNPSHP